MKAILFDLDGTLLPMDQNAFTKAYFKLLSGYLAPHGVEPKAFSAGMWSGINAMLANDGSEFNDKAFWRAFEKAYGKPIREYIPLFDEFYRTEFDALKSECGVKSESATLIKTLKTKGYRLVLATNPVFPFEAYKKRTAWTGVDISDFELVTTYENSHYCKPKTGYYREILDKIGCAAQDCVMVGNDVGDDMPAADIGIDVFLLPEYLINNTDKKVEDFSHGGFEELLEYIN